jgi:hypothetical protein
VEARQTPLFLRAHDVRYAQMACNGHEQKVGVGCHEQTQRHRCMMQATVITTVHSPNLLTRLHRGGRTTHRRPPG